jgi:nucleotide-binding universal stress UspA family protein
VFLIVLSAAMANLFTKSVATASGLVFTGVFLSIFIASDRYHQRQRRGEKHEHREQFNRALVESVTADSLGLSKPYCKLVAIRSPHNLYMLDKALADTDPLTTEVVIMTAKVEPPGAIRRYGEPLDLYDSQLLTAVVEHAERLGKPVAPLLVPTNHALHAVLKTAHDLPAQELFLGASNKYTAEEQLDQIALYWISLHGGTPRGLTVHIVGPGRDITFDLEGGHRIPTAAERKARSAAELRGAGVGVRRLLMTHDGTRGCSDVFEWLCTMLADDVVLDIVPVPAADAAPRTDQPRIETDRLFAKQLGRAVEVLAAEPQTGPAIVRLAIDGGYDALVVLASQSSTAASHDSAKLWTTHVVQHAPCAVFVAAHPAIPREVVT